MATIVLSVIIFGTAGYIIYRSLFLKKGSCECDACDCPAKSGRSKK
ncbi:FeoB-associated Cys-rich membrane protein [Vagococcus intermedius]|uniref:FeoB-associated Cys-rich membrane protein n=1 Tax=Vagococcus intermedius TaxID=2991418 RepID=A0AAF0CWI2_9ENTE|nr:FeoB-associated Cys-rich membrane protein [Vagococcus intermedius]WEG74289.1 FeoB-associated Cys-rich membrane protein [Vagococcus intermedius]WEG76372.1 FeoB-associated Cys-rich membrane protein [Vagococcus intermedius]